MAECCVCGKEIQLSCAEERERNQTCFDCAMKIEADMRYKHDHTIRQLVDALRLCAPWCPKIARDKAENALEFFGGSKP